MELTLKATKVYQKNHQNQKRLVVNQGGTGSSKTYSLAQLFITKCLEDTGNIFSIVRLSMPTLRASAMRDFFNILRELNLYSEENHKKTENVYYLNGNEVEFFGMEEPQKARSRRRDYLWINEANELSYEAFRQLNMRTNKQVFLDFNPSDEFHWIYDHVLTREDAELIVSTYKDNPFLPREVVKEIEEYKKHDENYWNIYGLGQRGAKQARIYTHYQLIDGLPTSGESAYGLDFGYNHPAALTKVILNDNDIYADEVIYESHLTTNDLITKMNDMGISKKTYIYCDSENPDAIEELSRAGFNALPCNKGPNSVKSGIDMIKSRAFYITKRSSNGIKELQTYSWRVKGDLILDEPVKLRDDFCDSIRNVVYTIFSEPEPQMIIV